MIHLEFNWNSPFQKKTQRNLEEISPNFSYAQSAFSMEIIGTPKNPMVASHSFEHSSHQCQGGSCKFPLSFAVRRNVIARQLGPQVVSSDMVVESPIVMWCKSWKFLSILIARLTLLTLVHVLEENSPCVVGEHLPSQVYHVYHGAFSSIKIWLP
jgi:hypothetical protein